jgi:hypothetical protein
MIIKEKEHRQEFELIFFVKEKLVAVRVRKSMNVRK